MSFCDGGRALMYDKALEVGFLYNDVDLPQGSFTVDISSLRASYSFSTKLSTNVLLQHNSLDNEISANVRLNFIHRPGSDFFVAFTENRGSNDRLWEVQDRGLVTKVTYPARSRRVSFEVEPLDA